MAKNLPAKVERLAVESQGEFLLETKDGEPFVCTHTDLLKVTLILVDEFSREMLNGDLVQLVLQQVVNRRGQTGLDDDKFMAILRRIAVHMEANRRSNPMSCMF